MTKHKKRKKGSNSSDLDASIGNEDHQPENEDSGKAHEITMSTSKEAMEIFVKELISQYDKKMDDRFSKFEKDFKDHFENRFASFSKVVTKLSEDYHSLIENVKTVSFKADNNEEKIRHLVEELEKRDVKIKSLADEVDDLRNRGMRKTIIIRGLPEGIEGKDSWENVRAFVASFLEKQGIPEIETDRAHHSAKKITSTSSQSRAINRKKPRPVFCELLTWQDANQILRKASAIGKKDFTYKEEYYRVSIEQMVSKKVLEERQTALKVRKYLLSEHPGWAITIKFPAILMIKKAPNEPYLGHIITESEVKKADDFIDSISK